MNRLNSFLIVALVLTGFAPREDADSSITIEQLRSKIEGAWVGHAIGTTLAIQTFYDFEGSILPDYCPLQIASVGKSMSDYPGQYTSLLLDAALLTALSNHESQDLQDAFGHAVQSIPYSLPHSIQLYRYSQLHELPVDKTHWLQNPHANDLDFFYTADLVGLMFPGSTIQLVPAASKLGHFTSYGDGYYGGLYVSMLYSLAFTEMKWIDLVEAAMSALPERSDVYQCLSDAVRLYRQHPRNWQLAWHSLQNKWGEDVGCSMHVYRTSNHDARLNAAYITLALLYGDGNFLTATEIAVRSSPGVVNNAAIVAALHGIKKGIDVFPTEFSASADSVMNKKLPASNMTLNEAIDATVRQVFIHRQVAGDKGKKSLRIFTERPAPVEMERSFEGHYPSSKELLHHTILKDSMELEFTGIGAVICGEAEAVTDLSEHNFIVDVFVDGKWDSKIELPTNYLKKRPDVFWKYQLPHREHRIKLKLLNPSKDHRLRLSSMIVYDVR